MPSNPDFARLRAAVSAIYYAAHWSPDRHVDNESALWAELRDAAGLEPGNAPTPKFEQTYPLVTALA